MSIFYYMVQLWLNSMPYLTSGSTAFGSPATPQMNLGAGSAGNQQRFVPVQMKGSEVLAQFLGKDTHDPTLPKAHFTIGTKY